MHQDYNFFIPLTSKKGKFEPQTNIFTGKNIPLSIKPYC